MEMLESELVRAAEPDSRCLMVVLHGLGDSLEGYRWLPPTLDLPWMNYLLVNGPDDYYGGHAWFDFPGDPGPGVRRSGELLRTFLEAQREAGFPSERTMVFGFSQGCLMAVETGLRYPHRLAGLVGISGFVHEPEVLLRECSPVALEQRFLITHGTFDPLLPLKLAQPQFDVLRRGGVQIEWHEFPKEHTIDGERELSVIRDFVRGCFDRGAG